MTPEQIQKNIKARQCAEELFNLGESECFSGQLNEKRFWETLAERCANKLGMVLVDSEKMTDKEAGVFEHSTHMPYGKYQGLTLDVVMDEDPEYLAWINENNFAKDLCKYLHSDYYKEKYLKG